MTTSEKIEAICKNMVSWEYVDLLQWARDARAEMLTGISPENIDLVYRNEVQTEEES